MSIKKIATVFKRISICLSLVFSLVVLNSCLEYKNAHRPYCLNQADILFEDSNGDIYFISGSGSYFLCKYNFEDYGHREVCRFYEENEYYNFEVGASNSDYLFVGLRPGHVELPPIIKVLNKSFEEVNRISLTNKDAIVGLACSDQFVYICKYQYETKTYSLIRNDCLSDSSFVLVDDLKGMTSYQDDDISLFFKIKSSFGNYLGKYDEKTKLIGTFSCLYTDKIVVDLSSNSIVISNCGEKHSFKKQHRFNRFYKKAFLSGNDLYFATCFYSNGVECGENPDSDECFCGVKQSYLFHFNTLTNELDEIGSFEPGTFLIDYDSSSVKYYYDGALYINDELIRECEKIQPNPSSTDDYKSYYYKPNYYLSYYNGQFYGI